MGELFRQTRPEVALDWTGERMVTSQIGALQAEHFHRYFLARQLCCGRDVLDVGSGEGYGSAFLAQTARQVVGLELDRACVEHASREYRSPNLRFVQGEAGSLPIADHSIDVVVSFETIEHIFNHHVFIAEVKRVLRPSGFLFISTPDISVYSAPGMDPNPFHVKELTEEEFRTILSNNFHNVELVRQRAVSGSAILSDAISSCSNSLSIFEQRDNITFEAARRLLRAPYLLAIASDQPLPAIGVSLFIQGQYGGEIKRVMAELKEVRKQYEAELRKAAERTHQEWSQRIQVEKALDAATAKTHSEWSQRVRTEEGLSKVSAELSDLRHRYDLDLQTAAAEFSDLRHRYDLDLQTAAAELSELRRRYDLDLQAAAAKTHVEWTQRVQLEDELTRIKERLTNAEKQGDFYSNLYYQSVNSRSWKVTKPLRALNSVFHGRRAAAPEPRKDDTANPHEPNASEKENDEAGVPFDRDGWCQYGKVRLANFLDKGSCLSFARCDEPTLSIILVLFNKAQLTLLSLESILANADISYELIIVDNASTDETGDLLKHLCGIQTIINTRNVGFGPACMRAVEIARAPYLCFFNNDALLQPKALGIAVENFKRSSNIGAVGGKILLANGNLQEAGSIVWSDGSALGYGRTSDPSDPSYEFRRPVDYCSGAFLFTPRALFSDLGGFREKFAPAYYEDTDYCLRVWQHGMEVIYEPQAVIRHYESASSGENETAQLQMAAKQAAFVSEWAQSLPRHLSPSMPNLLRARIATASLGLRILYLDDRIPHRELGSGFPRSNDVLKHLVAQGHHVACVALNFPLAATRDEYRDIPREVELVDATRDTASILKAYLPAFDLLWVSRPHNMERYLRVMEDSCMANGLPIIYDAEAIFSDRDRLKAQVEGHKISSHLLNARSATEVALACAADVTLAVSERDAKSLLALGVPSVRVLGHSMGAVPTGRPYSERTSFLFLGAIHGEDSPNLDSLRYFCREAWPIISKSTGAEFVIAGFGSENFESAFKTTPRVRVLGFQRDTLPLYQSARVFVVPTRYCAGVPYKAHEAAAHGVPMVVTPIIRDQLGWVTGEDVLVAENAQLFADNCIKLFNDVSVWSKVRDNALRRVRAELSSNSFDAAIASVLSELRNQEGEQWATHMSSAAVSH